VFDVSSPKYLIYSRLWVYLPLDPKCSLVGLAWDLVHFPGVFTQPREIPKTKTFNLGLAIVRS
jgi:hypothetical protein